GIGGLIIGQKEIISGSRFNMGGKLCIGGSQQVEEFIEYIVFFNRSMGRSYDGYFIRIMSFQHFSKGLNGIIPGGVWMVGSIQLYRWMGDSVFIETPVYFSVCVWHPVIIDLLILARRNTQDQIVAGPKINITAFGICNVNTGCLIHFPYASFKTKIRPCQRT